MITTGYFFQKFHLYDNTMLRNFFHGKFIFHIDLHRNFLKKCFSISAAVRHISAHVVASVLPILDHSVGRSVVAEPMHLGCAGTPVSKVAA